MPPNKAETPSNHRRLGGHRQSAVGRVSSLGRPQVHLRLVDSTNERARRLAQRGAPHGTLVTASEQTAGRGRQGRTWTAPRGRAILASVVVRDPPHLLPLAAGVAVAEVASRAVSASIKWPNDVLVGGRKVAGILVEGRPQERWAVVGIGVNVAVRDEDLPRELRATATGLGLEPADVEPTLERLVEELDRWLEASDEEVLEGVRARDALLGQLVRWAGGEGEAAGVDCEGQLLVMTEEGQVALKAGEVHLVRS
jgi:BirA family transcriptional regulator, biotin operon repressor / biotin---[acetyl-CoA-carboxylase] ligase